MSGGLIAAVVAIFLILRLWSRRRHATSDRQARSWAGPFKSDVALVAAREMRERFRARIFRVGTLLILVVVAAAIVIPTLDKGNPRPLRVGLVGALPGPLRATVVTSAKSVGTSVRFVSEDSAHAAGADLRSGHIDLAIIDGRALVVDKPIAATDTSTSAEFVLAVSKGLGLVEAVAAAHLTPAQSSALAGARSLPVHSLQPAKGNGATHTTSLIGLILVFVMLSQYNTWILIGVMEEKSSRVIEVLLAAVRPVQLLTGKVLGIGLVAFAQASLIVVFTLVLAKSVGSDLLHGTAPMVLVSTLAWLVLGYAFYCWVYAAAGSLAERQDQVQSLAFPLSLPIIFGYIMGLTAAGSGSASSFFKVLAYLPPTAPFAMPVLVGLGAVTWWEFLASAAISVLCTVGLAKLATLIYSRAILRTGRRVKLREVLTRAAA
ncbi:MAG: ABC transporter permease [Acidimicrobiales bacterium]|jgi:ABC-2 type transport system permease protein